ncbi:MAG: helix-turn-helix transcriptional regulator [Tannerellaceae bacterium]|jgi:DNA-binding CsgD family transcriptional regulator|nr:helix-turn-helix transcriptional regulator [Tannerellaceae bacterium]
MPTKDDFFIKENEITFIPEEYYVPMKLYVQFLDAFARSTYKSIYVIDYYKKNFLYVSDNPLFLCGMSAEEVQEMGYEFYINQVPESNLPLLLEINRAGFIFAENVPGENRLEYTLSYDFQIKQPKRKNLLINHKITPLHLTDNGKIWLALCTASLSSHLNIGNIEVTRKGYNMRWKYNLETHCWTKSAGVDLKDYEKEVLYLSAQGYTMNEISGRMCKSLDTIKGYKRQIFEKLGVGSITEAVNMIINEKII